MTITFVFTKMALSLFPDILEMRHPMHGPLSWHHLWSLHTFPRTAIVKYHKMGSGGGA